MRGLSILAHFAALLGHALLCFDPLLLAGAVLRLFQQLRLCIAILCLDLVEILILAGLLLLLWSVLSITVSLLGLIEFLHSVSCHVLVLSLSSLALASERALLLRRISWAPVD